MVFSVNTVIGGGNQSVYQPAESHSQILSHNVVSSIPRRPDTSHWQILSHKHSTPRPDRDSNISGDRPWFHR
jgi:hypothetical protein